MIENGKVITVNGNKATVRLNKTEQCDKCGMCLFPASATYIDVTADNTIGATEGQTVRITRSSSASLLGVFMVFLVPLLLIGLSVLINYLLINSDIWMAILSVSSVFLWYTVLAVTEKFFKKQKSFMAKITEIIKGEKENE